jgi:hypothetical protein
VIYIPYLNGGVLVLGTKDATEVQQYLEYSDYIFTKLAREPTVPPQTLGLLKYLDLDFRIMLGLRYSRNYQREVTSVLRNIPYAGMVGVTSGASVGVEAYPVVVAMSERVVPYFTRMDVSPVMRLSERLTGRKWGSALAFRVFLATLGGMPPPTTDRASLAVREQLQQTHWENVFPSVFVPSISLKGWNAEVEAVLGTFATDRHTSRTTVEKVLGFKYA